MDPTYPLFPIFAFLGFLLPLIPLPWHLQAWNSGTCYYMLWSSLVSLCWFVNSVVWHNNAINWAPVWCDISTRVYIGASVGLPAASLCINRRLYRIASVKSVSIAPADKRRAIVVDSLICVFFPLVFIAIQHIVTGHRFNILEDIGCTQAILNTLPTYFLYIMWPIVLGLISAIYCTLTLRAFFRRRLEFSRFLAVNKSMSASRYFRLMALSMTEMLCTVPLAIVTMYLNLTSSPLIPWRGLEDAHYNWSRVVLMPAVVWRANRTLYIGLECTRWTTIGCSFVFFAFFGFAEEARRNYYKAYLWVRKMLRLPVRPSEPAKGAVKFSSASKCDFVRTPRSPAPPSYTPSLPILDIRKTDTCSFFSSPLSTSSFDRESICTTAVPTSPDTLTNFKFSWDLEKGKEDASHDDSGTDSGRSFHAL